MSSTTITTKREICLWVDHIFSPEMILEFFWEPHQGEQACVTGDHVELFSNYLSMKQQQDFLSELRETKRKLNKLALSMLAIKQHQLQFPECVTNCTHKVTAADYTGPLPALLHNGCPLFAQDLSADDVRLYPSPMIRSRISDDDLARIRLIVEGRITSIMWTMEHYGIREHLRGVRRSELSSSGLGSSSSSDATKNAPIYEVLYRMKALIVEFQPQPETVETLVL